MHRVASFDVDNQNTNYLYVNQLSQNTSYFRANETYRLGVQFQYKTGEWSEPIWLEDYTVGSDEGRPYFISGSQFNLYLPQIAVDWDSNVDTDYEHLDSLIEAGYINVRPVVVLPETYERTVLTQGLVSSTVFQVGARSNNTPHSFASWMFRPMGAAPSIDENVEDKGAVVEWRHLHPLVSGKSSAAEIQNMAFAEDAETGYDENSKRRVLKDYEKWQEIIGTESSLLFGTDLCVNYFGLDTIKAALDNDIESVNNIWYVDQSICTLHSPDIEFNSAISSLLDSEPNISMQVSGIVTFQKTLSALDIDLSTVQADPDSTGEKNRTFSSDKGNGLVSFLAFNDGLIDDFKDNGGSLLLAEYDDITSKHGSRNWLTHLWHRTGSLNNDAVRPSTDTGTRTAEIQTKKISNLRIANYTYWLKNAAALSLAIRDIAVFDSDEISLVKLQDDYNDLGDIIYFGNVDVLNPTYTAFKLVYGTGLQEAVTDDDDDDDSSSSSSVKTVYFVGSVYRKLASTSSYSYGVPLLFEQTIPITVTSILIHSNDKITITGTINQESIDFTEKASLRSTTTYYGTTTALYGQEITFLYNGSQWEATTVTVDGDTFVFTPSVISYDADGAEYITADNVVADNVLGTNTVEELGYLTPVQDSDSNGNTENDDEVQTDSYLGDYYTAVFAPKDGVRIKYKSTPHGVFDFQYKNYQYDNITTLTHLSMPVLEGIESLDDDTDYYDVVATPVTYNDNNITRAAQFWLTTANSDANSIMTYNYTFNTTAFVNDYPSSIKSYLWLCEIMQEDVENRFGGDSYEALLNNTWLPAGPAVSLESIRTINTVKAHLNINSSTIDSDEESTEDSDEESTEDNSDSTDSSDNIYGYEDGNIWWQWGDTWYQRYDCLKTYPYSTEDVNQLVEIGSFFVETNVNIDGRYDRNRGLVDNTNISPTNFNLINDVYTQKNNFFTYTILDDDYYKTVKYPAQFIWSGVKTPGATTDEWARTHLASSVDLDGSKGSLTAITCFADTVIGLQEKAMQRINFNPRALVDAGEGVSGVPIEIAQSLKVDGFNKLYDVGCQDKFSVLNTPNALYFVDHNNYILYSFDSKNGLAPLSENSGMRYWLKNNHAAMSWMLRADDDYTGTVNGIRLFYDSKYQDVYLTPGAQLLSSDDSYFYPESLVFSEQLSRFTSLMSYGGSAMFEYDGRQYALAYSLDDDSFNIYEMHSEDINSYNTIFDKVFPFSFSFIFNGDSPGTAKHMENIELRADCYDYTDSDGNSLDRIELQGGDYNIAKQDGIPFDFIRVRNEYQDTGIQYFNTLKDGAVALQTPTLRKKFRVWRAQIPRGTEGKNYRGQASRERIYNTWSEITLGKENPSTSMTILHNLNVTGGMNKQE